MRYIQISIKTFSRGIFNGTGFHCFFYGIGNDTKDEDEEQFTPQGVALDIIDWKKIGKHTFVGGRYNLISNQIIEKDSGGMLSTEGLIPGADGGTSSGLGLTFRY